MASQPTPPMPMLYEALEPINRQAHGDKTVSRLFSIPSLGTAHALPVTVDEFMLAGRHYPIIFSTGEDPVPLALMGLHEGTNTFYDADGKPREQSLYIPAYIRRYPFLLARLSEDSDQLSLCVDPTSGVLGDDPEGQKLFDGESPSEATNSILAFCEQFEQAGQRTTAFMKELQELDLLMDGEVAIQPEGSEKPFIYRGFRMVDEQKFRDLRGDELRKMNQNGMLSLIMAHLFSLSLVRELFSRQVAQGTGPKGLEVTMPAEA